ncbi:unnamed protein product, partial [Arctogadus glacialis]
GAGQMVQMDSVKSGFVGATVELKCIFVNSNPPVKISRTPHRGFSNLRLVGRRRLHLRVHHLPAGNRENMVNLSVFGE